MCVFSSLDNSHAKHSPLCFSCSERNSDDLALIYEELVHIKALQHLSTMVSD